ncbi:unnamed protein product [Rotaria sp. Silwood2]|nr:unnamed protein product [Rotaria sp. Silwood2]CAF4446381.1 unnamed protein product [Rotaria sp. Silwood2]CAF4505584.1 unnamed protein product [Rotaria sp. Silwood2]
MQFFLVPDHRAQPTSCDIAASATIFKIRRSLNNRDLDVICKLASALNVQDVPKSMREIQEKLHSNIDLKAYFKWYHICTECRESNVKDIIKCEACDNAK